MRWRRERDGLPIIPRKSPVTAVYILDWNYLWSCRAQGCGALVYDFARSCHHYKRLDWSSGGLPFHCAGMKSLKAWSCWNARPNESRLAHKSSCKNRAQKRKVSELLRLKLGPSSVLISLPEQICIDCIGFRFYKAYILSHFNTCFLSNSLYYLVKLIVKFWRGNFLLSGSKLQYIALIYSQLFVTRWKQTRSK